MTNFLNSKISLIGTGKLGLCLGLNLEKKGFHVLGCDLDITYVQSLNNKKYCSSEPGVNELLIESRNIHFTTNLEECVNFSEILFIMVATPSLPNNKYDHSQIEAVISELEKLGRQNTRKNFIIGCTTFPGYCQSITEKLNALNYEVLYNPEFIAQGNILHGQINPDMVLIGESSRKSGDLLEMIYNKMCNNTFVFSRMSLTEAELTKLSINCFMTTKISFANMIGDIAKRMNCDPDVILRSVGSDSRIGSKYLNYGFGFGGPCFPRDNRALQQCAAEVGIDAIISRSTDEMNAKHLDYQVENFITNNPDKDKIVEIDYVTYKKDSSIIEESQQLKFAMKLKELGYNILITDTRIQVTEQIKHLI
jgi:UDPglucose 6-dehydrogenase